MQKLYRWQFPVKNVALTYGLNPEIESIAGLRLSTDRIRVCLCGD